VRSALSAFIPLIRVTYTHISPNIAS